MSNIWSVRGLCHSCRTGVLFRLRPELNETLEGKAYYRYTGWCDTCKAEANLSLPEDNLKRRLAAIYQEYTYESRRTDQAAMRALIGTGGDTK